MFNTILLRLRKRPAAVAASSAAETGAEAQPAEAAEERRVCGWFDSSHALRRGLLVTEHASSDAVANDLPLADWLAMQLSGWQVHQPVAAAALHAA